MSSGAGTTASSTCWIRCRSAPRRRSRRRSPTHRCGKRAERRKVELQSWVRGAGLERAAELLDEECERIVSNYRYPQADWRHLRTTNVIESPFAALRLRNRRAKAIQEGSQRHCGDLEAAAGGGEEVPEAERSGATPRGREPNTETELESTIIRSGTLPDSLHLLTQPPLRVRDGFL